MNKLTSPVSFPFLEAGHGLLCVPDLLIHISSLKYYMNHINFAVYTVCTKEGKLL